MHDSATYQKCQLGSMTEHFFSENEFLLGDEAYALGRHLITPYKNKRQQRNQDGRNANGHTEEEAHYNRIVVHERVAIENAFGRIKRRYPILKMLRNRIRRGDDPENYTRHMKNDILRIEKLLKSIVILQNFTGKEGRTGELDDYIDQETEAVDEQVRSVNYYEEENENGKEENTSEGNARRNQVTRILWQMKGSN
ncbi:hypothetical protein TRICI_004323 [Trichomonascus ciferrii]|uniref:DDE Tnp4 domain-containing protein n=1 Tax=Trichomonascus ciferrii TaxID=44093 RepID=A0A642V190_9ASCO|nr:hypothetical protein TRICI_004323 [Trichomonascus ciferrii]